MADGVVEEHFRFCFSGEDEEFFTVAVDVELASAHHGRDFRLVLQCLPYRVVDSIRLKQLFMQV